MKKSGGSQGQSASELISKRITELGDWRGDLFSFIPFGWQFRIAYPASCADQ